MWHIREIFGGTNASKNCVPDEEILKGKIFVPFTYKTYRMDFTDCN